MVQGYVCPFCNFKDMDPTSVVMHTDGFKKTTWFYRCKSCRYPSCEEYEFLEEIKETQKVE